MTEEQRVEAITDLNAIRKETDGRLAQVEQELREQRELRRRKITTRAFKKPVSFFYPYRNTPKDFAKDLLQYIDPELMEGVYTYGNPRQETREALRVFQLVVKGLP